MSIACRGWLGQKQNTFYRMKGVLDTQVSAHLAHSRSYFILTLLLVKWAWTNVSVVNAETVAGVDNNQNENTRIVLLPWRQQVVFISHPGFFYSAQIWVFAYLVDGYVAWALPNNFLCNTELFMGSEVVLEGSLARVAVSADLFRSLPPVFVCLRTHVIGRFGH